MHRTAAALAILLACACSGEDVVSSPSDAPSVSRSYPTLGHALLRARQDGADAAYAFDAALVARDPQRGTVTHVGARGARISASDVPDALLALERWGCTGSERAVADAQPSLALEFFSRWRRRS